MFHRTINMYYYIITLLGLLIILQSTSLYRLIACGDLITCMIGTTNICRKFVRFDIATRKLNFIYVHFSVYMYLDSSGKSNSQC